MSIDTFTEVMMQIATHDAARSKGDHTRITSLRATERPYCAVVRVRISHKKPDGELKAVSAGFMIHPLYDRLAGDVIKSVIEGHEMLDKWAFAVSGDFTEDTQEK